NARKKSKTESESEHRQIDAYTTESGNKLHGVARHRGFQQFKTEIGQEHSEQTSDNGKNDALRDQLLHNTQTACSERRSNRYLFEPPRRAGKHKVGDIGAGNQQHESDRAHQYGQRGFIFAHRVVKERIYHDGSSGVAFRILLFESSGYRFKIGASLRYRDPF